MRPYQVLIFIIVVMAVLGGLYLAIPEQDMSEPEIVSIDLDTIAEFPVLADSDTTLPAPQDTIIPTPKPVIPKVSVDSTTDSRIFLASFYASLYEADSRTIRVLHYGDSQIEEDRMTMSIREQLQKRFGGRGVGLMPLAQTIPTLTVKQELHMSGRFVMPQQGPRRYLVFGPKRDQRADGLYGPMGQMAMMNDSLVKGSEEVIAVCHPLLQSTLYERWRVFADSSVHYSFSGDTVRLSGRGAVYGLSQESRTGVIVDNIPMRGCIGLVFTKMESQQLQTFYREQNVRLIILQFGGNAIPFNEKPSTIQAIVSGLRQQVRYLRACAPEASILFIAKIFLSQFFYIISNLVP